MIFTFHFSLRKLSDTHNRLPTACIAIIFTSIVLLVIFIAYDAIRFIGQERATQERQNAANERFMELLTQTRAEMLNLKMRR